MSIPSSTLGLTSVLDSYSSSSSSSSSSPSPSPTSTSVATMTTEQAPKSGVAAIANRFNTAVASDDKDGIRLSDKVSNLANRFGTTVVDDEHRSKPINRLAHTIHQSSNKRSSFSSALSSSPSSEKQQRDKPSSDVKDSGVVSESSGRSVGDVAKFFDSPRKSSSTGVNIDNENDEEEQKTGFSSAHDLFRKAEEAMQKPRESMVSSFAKRIEAGEHAIDRKLESNDQNSHTNGNGTTTTTTTTNGDSAVTTTITENGDGDDDDDGNNVGNVVSKFETAVAKENKSASDPSGATDPEDVDSLENRFANATKLFESGTTNTIPMPVSMPITTTSTDTTNISAAATNTDAPDEGNTQPTDVADATQVVEEKLDDPIEEEKEEAEEEEEKEKEKEKQKEEEQVSPQSRFADAARMFGGGA